MSRSSEAGRAGLIIWWCCMYLCTTTTLAAVVSENVTYRVGGLAITGAAGSVRTIVKLRFCAGRDYFLLSNPGHNCYCEVVYCPETLVTYASFLFFRCPSRVALSDLDAPLYEVIRP